MSSKGLDPIAHLITSGVFSIGNGDSFSINYTTFTANNTSAPTFIDSNLDTEYCLSKCGSLISVNGSDELVTTLFTGAVADIACRESDLISTSQNSERLL